MTRRTPTLQTGIVHSKKQKIFKDEAMECIQELYVLMSMPFLDEPDECFDLAVLRF